MGPNDGLPRNGREVAELGCIVSFKAADGNRLTIHREGSIKKAAREACAIALARDETFRVVAVSTPRSILSDLQGSREEKWVGTEDMTGSGGGGVETYLRLPEYHIVPSELLHPTLLTGRNR